MKIPTESEEAEALKKRFADLKKHTGVSRAAFAREHGIKGGDAMIYQHIDNRRPISREAALAYAKGFNCTLEEISMRLAIEARESGLLLADATKTESIHVFTKENSVFVLTHPPKTGMEELTELASQLDTLRMGMLIKTARDLLAEIPAKQTPESTG